MKAYQCSHPKTGEKFNFAFTKNGLTYLHNLNNTIKLAPSDRNFKQILSCNDTVDYFIVNIKFDDPSISSNFIIYNKHQFVTADTNTYKPVYLETGTDIGGNPEFDKDNIGVLFGNKNDRTVQRYTIDEIYNNKEAIYKKHFMEQVYFDFHQNSYLKNKITQFCNNTSSDDDCDVLIDFLSLKQFDAYEVFMGDLGNDMAQDDLGLELLKLTGLKRTKAIYDELALDEIIDGIVLNVIFNGHIKFTFKANKVKDFYKTELRIIKK